jgi:uncharacterized protein YaaN involved in tellurite resistance
MATEKETEMGLDDFQLETPKVVNAIDPKKLDEKSGVENEKGEVQTVSKLEQSVITDLNNQVDKIMSDLMSTPVNSPEMKDITAALNRMGDAEITKTSNVSNRMLSRPMRGMRSNAYGEGDTIMKGLKDLRMKVTDLDPSRRDKLFSKDRFLGFKLPFGLGNKIDSYFQEYKSSESALADIIKSLSNGRDELLEDNAYIDEEREQMQDMMVRLEQYAYVMKRLDKKIEERLPGIAAQDQLKAEDIKQEILFPVRQKRMDILQHLAVSMQGYMALQVIKQNNQELIRGVDRAKNTTTTALRTAIIVSEALGTQKLVLDQINQVNEVTNRMIERNSEMLGKQGVEIQKQAVESAVNAETLEKAFQNIFKAMDAIDSYRSNALPQMEKTVNSLEKSVANAKNYLSSRREERIGDFATEVMKDTNTPDTKGPGVVKIRP